MAYDGPAYTVLRDDGRVQIRAYAPMIVAEVTIATEEGAAPNAAFRPLFGYISGQNTAQSKIAMTAPVTQTQATGATDGVTIAMTAPVTQTAAVDADGEAWTVAFIMPADWTLDTLPTPNDSRIRLREVPARTVASLRYAGRSRPNVQASKRVELQDWLAQNGYQPIGAPEVAFYNAPFVPGPLRRNEILVPVEAIAKDSVD